MKKLLKQLQSTLSISKKLTIKRSSRDSSDVSVNEQKRSTEEGRHGSAGPTEKKSVTHIYM